MVKRLTGWSQRTRRNLKGAAALFADVKRINKYKKTPKIDLEATYVLHCY